MTEPADDFEESLPRTDPDRWLASRFIADEQARADVLAIYAYDGELGRAPRAASNALIGEIRLTWWREALDEIYEDRRVRGHPAARGLAAAVRRHALPRAPLEAMIDARYRELDPGPFDRADAQALADGTSGRSAEVAARILGEAREAPLEAIRACGRLWGLSLMLLGGRVAPDDVDAVRAEAALLLSSARVVGPALIATPVFPAIAHATLAEAYLHGRRPSELKKRLRLTWAVARGRI
jgi:15-cis-phytoene synthase